MPHWEWLPAGTAPAGFCCAGVRAGIKTDGLDLALIGAPEGSSSAAVFTQNQFCAPPVLLSRQHAASGHLRAIVANSGNANCCTGEHGLQHAREMAALAAQILNIRPEEVLVGSTGIIGHTLPIELIRDAAPALREALQSRTLTPAAEAILTTDTEIKQSSLRVQVADRWITISGMTKGAGMVGPRMATVFAFLCTDAAADPAFLQGCFSRVMNRSINRVVVDADTSTNDTACLLASGAAEGPALTEGGPGAEEFEAALLAVAQSLARQLARGGEGANHLVTIRVEEAPGEAEAEQIALTIASSPLVKTALFGKDPNWGRIAMAAGRAGVPFEQSAVNILLQDVLVMERGQRVEFDRAAVSQALAAEEVQIVVRLGAGQASAEAWTCDFSYDYVKINAEYHT